MFMLEKEVLKIQTQSQTVSCQLSLFLIDMAEHQLGGEKNDN